MGSVSRHSDDRMGAAEYRVLLRAVIEGRATEAQAASAGLLAGGASALSVYRVVTRALLPRAASGQHRGGTPRLDALCGAVALSESLPIDEAQMLLIRATGWAVNAGSSGNTGPPEPCALPALSSAKPAAWTAADWGQRVRAAASGGEGAAAEWALGLLLAGPDGGTLPTRATRQAAYAALFAASAEHAGAEWGRLLVATQYGMEMAELLPPALTLLALRPALWAIARATSHRTSRATTPRWWDVTDASCALRWNRREARPGETAEWARALRAGPLHRVVEEALASGLGAPALLDVVLLAALAPAGSPTGAPPQGGLSGPAARVVLASHAARRAYALADRPTAPLLAALDLLERLPRLPQVRLAPRANAAPGVGLSVTDLTDVARAAVHRATPSAVLFGAAIAREYAGARQRAPDYAALLLRGVVPWLGPLARGDVATTPAHRAS